MAETLTAGRELDALVAEKVFGTVPTWNTVRTMDGPRKRLSGTVPSYSTDIAAAWQVAEDLKRRGWYPMVYVDDTGDLVPPVEPQAWFAKLDPNWRDLPEVRGESAAHAICLVALQALKEAEALRNGSPTLSVLASPVEGK